MNSPETVQKVNSETAINLLKKIKSERTVLMLGGLVWALEEGKVSQEYCLELAKEYFEAKDQKESGCEKTIAPLISEKLLQLQEIIPDKLDKFNEWHKESTSFAYQFRKGLAEMAAQQQSDYPGLKCLLAPCHAPGIDTNKLVDDWSAATNSSKKHFEEIIVGIVDRNQHTIRQPNVITQARKFIELHNTKEELSQDNAAKEAEVIQFLEKNQVLSVKCEKQEKEIEFTKTDVNEMVEYATKGVETVKMLKERLDEQSTKATKLQNEVQLLTGKTANLAAENHSIKQTYSQREKELIALQREYHELKINSTNFIKEKNELAVKISNLEQIVETAKASLGKASEESRTYQLQVTAAQKKLDDTQSQIDKKEKKISEMQKELDAEKNKPREDTAKTKEIEKKIVQYEQDMSSLKAELETKQNKLAGIEKKAAEFETKYTSLLDVSGKDIQKKENEIRKIQTDAEAKETLLNKSKEELHKLETGIAELAKDNKLLAVKKSEIESRYTLLEQEKKAAISEKETAIKQLGNDKSQLEKIVTEKENALSSAKAEHEQTQSRLKNDYEQSQQLVKDAATVIETKESEINQKIELIKTLNESNKSLENRLDAAGKMIAQGESTIQKLAGASKEIQTKYDSITEQLTQIRADIKTKESELSEKNRALGELSENERGNADKIASMQKEHAKMQDALKETVVRAMIFETQRDDYKAKLQDSKIQLNAKLEEQSNLQSSMADLRKELEDKAKQFGKVKVEFNELSASYHNDKEQWSRELADSKQTFDAVEKQLFGMVAQYNEKCKEYDRASKGWGEAHNKKIAAERELHKTKTVLQVKEAEVARSKEEISKQRELILAQKEESGEKFKSLNKALGEEHNEKVRIVQKFNQTFTALEQAKKELGAQSQELEEYKTLNPVIEKQLFEAMNKLGESNSYINQLETKVKEELKSYRQMLSSERIGHAVTEAKLQGIEGKLDAYSKQAELQKHKIVLQQLRINDYEFINKQLKSDVIGYKLDETKHDAQLKQKDEAIAGKEGEIKNLNDIIGSQKNQYESKVNQYESEIAKLKEQYEAQLKQLKETVVSQAVDNIQLKQKITAQAGIRQLGQPAAQAMPQAAAQSVDAAQPMQETTRKEMPGETIKYAKATGEIKMPNFAIDEEIIKPMTKLARMTLADIEKEQKAAAQLPKQEAQKPAGSYLVDERITSLLESGSKKCNQWNYKGALADFKQALKSSWTIDEQKLSYAWLERAYSGLGKHRKAIKMADKAYEMCSAGEDGLISKLYWNKGIDKLAINGSIDALKDIAQSRNYERAADLANCKPISMAKAA